MRRVQILLLLFISSQLMLAQTQWKVISNRADELVIHLSSSPRSPHDLSPINLLIGLPDSNLPGIQIRESASQSHPFNDISSNTTKWIHQQMVNGLHTGTLQISPTTENGTYIQDQWITIRFRNPNRIESKISAHQQEMLSPKIINWNRAKNWIKPKKRSLHKIKTIPDGHWIKMNVKVDGMVKVSGEELRKHIPTNINFDPRSIMLFTGSAFGRDRTYDLTQKSVSNTNIPDNLIELPISISGESDGNMSQTDILFFYAQGPSGFDQQLDKINWHQNLYFTTSVYWLLIPDDTALRGKRIDTGNIVADGPLSVDYGLSYRHFETDLVNPHKSGLAWGNTIIRQGGTFAQSLNLNHPVTSTTATGSFGMIGNENVSTRYGNTKHKATLSLSGAELADMEWSHLGLKSNTFTIPAGQLIDGEQSFQITNNSDNPNSEPYFDFFTLAYTRKLNYTAPFDFFSSVTSNDMTFSITGNGLNIWNITNTAHPENIPVRTEGDQTTMRVSLPADTLQRFMVFNLDDIATHTNLMAVGTKTWNQLRNTSNTANHIIIGPNAFSNAAQPLADHRQNTIFASIEDIYKEFSGENQDPIAIRHFLQWTKEYWPQKPLTVLFMGDADYDYRNITGLSKIHVPTIEVGTNYSHATDDRLVAFNGIIPEMATGRYPARSAEEVTAFVDKIVAFETSMPKGLWKQRVTLVADDPARPEKESYELYVGKSHTLNSERLAKSIPDFMEVKKLYMVEYPEENDGSVFGVTKPEATQALFNQLSSGTALINYIGHGNPTQWAQEKLLIINESRNDLESIKTQMKLPIWLAGTCNWGQFDAIDRESFAEELIRKEMDGASAVITTTRGITVSSNINYLESIFGQFFDGNSVSQSTIGTLLQSVKTGGSDGELFHLFGDPAMPLSIPSQLVRSATVSPDTLATLEVGTLSAQTPFDSGEGYLVFKDGANDKTETFQFASKQETITYLANGPTLFRGTFTFSNGSLSPQFRVPKDITYSKNNAKLRFNISDGSYNEALGAVADIPLTLGTPSTDTEGPIITFETQDGRMLRSGDHIPIDEILVIRLSDPLGINLTGEKGHELMIVDPVTESKTNAVDQFIYDTNSLNTGTIQFPIDSEDDAISLGISAWDNANNPTEIQIELFLLKSKKLDLLHVLNFPNPFANDTQFTFEVTASASVSIDVYTLEGRRIKSFYPEQFTLGYHRIPWDGRDEFGNRLANGVYLYKMTAENDGQKINHIGRLAIYR